MSQVQNRNRRKYSILVWRNLTRKSIELYCYSLSMGKTKAPNVWSWPSSETEEVILSLFSLTRWWPFCARSVYFRSSCHGKREPFWRRQHSKTCPVKTWMWEMNQHFHSYSHNIIGRQFTPILWVSIRARICQSPSGSTLIECLSRMVNINWPIPCTSYKSLTIYWNYLIKWH